MIKIFMGEGVVGGEAAVKDAWIGVVGVHNGLAKNILKQGVAEGKKWFVEGEGVLKVSPPLLPSEDINHTLVRVVFVQAPNECVMYVSCMYHECIRNVS